MLKLLVLLVTCTLAGCNSAGRQSAASTQSSYGNFLTTKLDPAPLAVESAKQLANRFPPAQTRMAVDPAPRDAFGLALVNQLRERGYAVIEPAPGDKPVADGSLVLRYVIDQQGTTPEDTTYRVLLEVGRQTLARLYTERNGQFEPISNWVRGESRR